MSLDYNISKIINYYIKTEIPRVNSYINRKESSLKFAFSSFTDSSKNIALFEVEKLDVLLLKNCPSFVDGGNKHPLIIDEGALIEIKFCTESYFELVGGNLKFIKKILPIYYKDIKKLRFWKRQGLPLRVPVGRPKSILKKNCIINNKEAYFILVIEVAQNILSIINSRITSKTKDKYPVGFTRDKASKNDQNLINAINSLRSSNFNHRIKVYNSGVERNPFNGVETRYKVIVVKY